ncbi:BON domain-containing protein [Roseateles sp. BYS96W]|uniref:BON domain-containing protein n=1 Tax=Pelomonas nitida TaxID=3299027 RepID=A0ABW7G308_9BURK
MSFRDVFSRDDREVRSLITPDGNLRVAPDAKPVPTPAPRVLLRRPAPRPRARVLPWVLAIAAGAAAALIGMAVMQDSRSVGTQLDDAVAGVRNAGDQAGQAVSDSQTAAVQASRDALMGVGAAIDDAGITAKVKAALAVDPALSAARIEVSTERGIVRLDGPAPDATARERAGVLAAAPAGVRVVDNRLTVPAAPGVSVAAAPR